MIRPGKPSPAPSNSLTAFVWSLRMARRFSAAAIMFSVGIIKVCVTIGNVAGLSYERSARNPRACGSPWPALGNQCRQYLAVSFRGEQPALLGDDRGIGRE